MLPVTTGRWERIKRNGSRKTNGEIQVKASLMNFWHLCRRVLTFQSWRLQNHSKETHRGSKQAFCLIWVGCWWSGSRRGSHSVQNLKDRAGFLIPRDGSAIHFLITWWKSSHNTANWPCNNERLAKILWYWNSERVYISLVLEFTERLRPPADPKYGPQQSESPHPLPFPWNILSTHCPTRWS